MVESSPTRSSDKSNTTGHSSGQHVEHVDMASSLPVGYGKERGLDQQHDIETGENPNVHHHFSARLVLSLLAMSFLWVGSQIPLYLFGGVIPDIYNDIGGYEIYTWLIIGYLIPNAALCPFVGALSDAFGRRGVAAVGQVLLIIGPVVTSTAQSMGQAIAGQVFSGMGAGLNELIALAGTAELVPVAKRGTYVGAVVFTILPFCPAVLWAQLIARASSWRYVGIVVAVWNLVGLLLVVFAYRDPARNAPARNKMAILREVDWFGGFLSTAGIVLFMTGMQWGARQYEWSSVTVLMPFFMGSALIAAFFVWEIKFAPFPMAPARLFSKAKRSMIAILLITFLSGGNFFVLLLFWPTQIYNVYGDDPVGIGIRALPVGFGIIVGAAIALVLIPLTRGRTTVLMLVSCIIMTAGTGAMSLARRDNLPAVYGILTVASLGVGAVIIPCSIIAQMLCPTDLIGTITAITLAIRYIGGAIGFTAYYNIFYAKLEPLLQTRTGFEVLLAGAADPNDLETLTTLVILPAQAMFDQLREFIATSPRVLVKDGLYDTIVASVQEQFVVAYQYPYWMSIAFGGISILCCFALQDVRKFM